MIFSVVSILNAGNEYVTSSGERWTYIKVPNFRKTASLSANQFASSYGRVMSNDGSITCADSDYLKISVPTLGRDHLAAGCSTTFALHTVICYTFNGNPPEPDGFTVDHINRKHWDNFYQNLRWATLDEQLNNREVCRFVVSYNGDLHQSYTSLSKVTGKRTSFLRGLIKQGDERLFQIVKRVKYDVRPVVGPTRPIRPVCGKSTYWDVFLYFTGGHSVFYVAEYFSLSLNTVISYVIKGARVAGEKERQTFRQRVGLTSVNKCKELERLVEQFKDSGPSKEDWIREAPRLYLSCCELADPSLTGIEYRIVQGTYKVIWLGVNESSTSTRQSTEMMLSK